MTDNLSGLVEALLSDFATRAYGHKPRNAKAIEANVSAWNDFNDKIGSIADEYHSL